MPKNRVRNAFYFYMLDFKEEQRRNGVNYSCMAEVADAASFSWENAPTDVRAKYTEMAKKDKNNKSIKGETVTVVHDQQLLCDSELQEIKNIVRLKSYNGEILFEDFYLMDVNVFCKTSNGLQYLIAESTVLRFSLQEGIKDYYHELINPGKIPIGYTYEAKLGSKDIGLELPDEMQRKSNYAQILANIMVYLDKQLPETNILPPLFTLPDKIAPINNFIHQMCNHASEDPNKFHVYRLDMLFFVLANALKNNPNDGFSDESQPLAKLTKHIYEYFTPGMGCEVHHLADKTVECTTTRAKCWAYKILGICCPIAGIEMKLKSHVPNSNHLENIHMCTMKQRERAIPSNQGQIRHDPCSSSSKAVYNGVPAVNDTVRSLEPLRMPKESYTRRYVTPDTTKNAYKPISINFNQEDEDSDQDTTEDAVAKNNNTCSFGAPDSTASKFSPLPLGIGRGRGLCAILNSMNIKN